MSNIYSIWSTLFRLKVCMRRDYQGLLLICSSERSSSLVDILSLLPCVCHLCSCWKRNQLFLRMWYNLSEFDLFAQNMNYFSVWIVFSQILNFFSQNSNFIQYPDLWPYVKSSPSSSWRLTLSLVRIWLHFTAAMWRNHTSKSPPKWINSIYIILIFDLTSNHFLHRLVHHCLWIFFLMSDSITGLW